jgi:hypothetical protein
VIDELPTAHRPQAVRSLSIAENDHQDTKMKSWAAKKIGVKFSMIQYRPGGGSSVACSAHL